MIVKKSTTMRLLTHTILGLCSLTGMASQAVAADSAFVDGNGDAIFQLNDGVGYVLDITSNSDGVYYAIYDWSTPGADIFTEGTLTNFTGNMVISVPNAELSLFIEDLVVPKSLTIKTDGIDGDWSWSYLSVDAATIGGNLNFIAGDKGDNTFDLIDSEVAGNARIVTKSGTDWVQVRGSLIAQKLTVSTGEDVDWIQIDENTIVDGPTVVSSGDGADIVNLIDFTSTSRVAVVTGDGDDEVVLNGANFSGQAIVRLGDGNDQLDVMDSGFTNLRPIFRGNNGTDKYTDWQNNSFTAGQPRMSSIELQGIPQ